jgi:glycine cleavage system H lipoate-binding protein
VLAADFLSTYPAKLLEYSLAAGYLVLFTAFWRYLRGGPAAQPVAEWSRGRPAGATAVASQGWFTLPGDVLLHPGHTWARAEAGGLVAVGLDDFAARLLGPVERMALPQAGAPVAQGAPAFAAEDGGRRVELVSPVAGEVAEVNPLAREADLWQFEPYGAGWLFKVRPARWTADERQLLAGESARRWLEQAGESLAARASPQLGAVLQDGGTPLHGIARELEPERWDELCREYFRS